MTPPILHLAWRSLRNRRYTALITVLTIALSVTLLLGVERLRTEAKSAFANTISGTDLIVGARTGGIQLLLYSVFHIGNATNNIGWDSYQAITADKRIAWSVPISLGDSHRGYRVVGTSTDFFRHYRYAHDRALAFQDGAPFAGVFDAVLGAEVADALGYRLGEHIVLAHGAGAVNLIKHSDKPFQVVGILAPTGTPIDRSVLVSLSGIEAIHADWIGGRPIPGLHIDAKRAAQRDLTPKTITAALLGLKSKVQTFRVQRTINDYRDEPLLAVLPGVALAELWNLMSVAENALLLVSAMVVLVGLTGMATALITSLEARRREMAILRSIGARPHHVLTLIVGEAAFLTAFGVVLGVALLALTLAVISPWLASSYGLYPEVLTLSTRELGLLALVFGAGVLTGLLPGFRAYRYSLADGLTVRL